MGTQCSAHPRDVPSTSAAPGRRRPLTHAVCSASESPRCQSKRRVPHGTQTEPSRTLPWEAPRAKKKDSWSALEVKPGKGSCPGGVSLLFSDRRPQREGMCLARGPGLPSRLLRGTGGRAWLQTGRAGNGFRGIKLWSVPCRRTSDMGVDSPRM